MFGLLSSCANNSIETYRCSRYASRYIRFNIYNIDLSFPTSLEPCQSPDRRYESKFRAIKFQHSFLSNAAAPGNYIQLNITAKVMPLLLTSADCLLLLGSLFLWSPLLSSFKSSLQYSLKSSLLSTENFLPLLHLSFLILSFPFSHLIWHSPTDEVN